MAFNKDKFKATVHHICKIAKTKDLGSTKLNKILWYADSINYLETGQSLTGETYKRIQYGPVPQHILPILDELEECNYLRREKTTYHGYPKTEFHCLEDPCTDLLSEDELLLVDELTDEICKNFTAASISQATHDRIWEIAEQGEEIPLYAMFASNIKDPSEAAKKWALSAIAEK